MIEYEPAVQLVHAVDPAMLKDPALHSMHEALLAAAVKGEKLPPAQATHETCREAEE